MKLVEIEIKNLKSITSALLSFPVEGDHQVSLLYGDNGAGKTTVLEAISLLGHLSTMRRICAGTTVSVKPSRFREYKLSSPGEERARIATQAREQYNAAAFAEQCDLISQEGIDKWWRATAVSGDPYRPARIRYRVLFKNQKIEFYISFLQGRDLSITEALSRDQNGPGERIHDGNMDNWFAVVYPLAEREHVEALIEHMRLVSPHSYWSDSNEYRTDSRTLKRPESHSIVGYWNTDLNDFGRKNDLRESVKKIRIDFADQMITRLGLTLPYGSATAPQYYEMTKSETVDADKLVALNDSLRVALVDHAIAMEGSQKRLKAGLIRIVAIDAREEPAAMTARRIGESKDIEIDHLSAGENESVFIFLLMHGMPCEESIILLDEPDLHLSDFAKSQFYHELYRIARNAQCQLIISTHSAFANSKADNASHYFIRRVTETDDTGTPRIVYKTDWDDAFGELLTFHYARCAVNAMAEAGPVWKALALPLKCSVLIGRYLGLQIWVAVTIFTACVGLYAMFATINDAFWPIVHFNAGLHRQIIVDATIVCGIICVICLFLRFATQLLGTRATRDI